MNKLRIGLLVILAGMLLFGCFLQDPFSNNLSGVEPSLPPDRINDVPRSYSDPFEFETLLPVEVDLTVALYESDTTSKSASLTSLTPDAATVVVTIHDSNGNLVFKGKIQEEGNLFTQLQIPAAPDDMTLTLQAEGFEERKVVIRDMRNSAEINRIMGMLRSTVAVKTVGKPDTDGDGVPNDFDDFPTDRLRAFVTRIPADTEEILTIAFEDLYLHAQAGDADYNDFIGQYVVEEILNDSNQIVEITGKAKAAVKIAGYNHRFGIFIDTFKGTGTLDINYYDKNGTLLPESFSGKPVDGYADILLFDSTKDMVGWTSTFHLKFDTPQLEIMVDHPPYNPYIYVYDTFHDIHMVGEQPLPLTENPWGSEFIDVDGFPWALLVPVDWVEKERYPEETQRIEIPYPRFTLWRESGGTEHTDWYDHYYDPYEPPVTRTVELAADINPNSGSSSPADLTVYDGNLYFSANDGTYGTELWRYDGTSASRHTDINASGNSLLAPAYLTVYKNELYFSATDSGTYGRELWKTDGASAARVTDINTGGDGKPSYLTIFNNNLYFSADDGEVPTKIKLFVHDGSTTTQVTNLLLPAHMAVYNNELYLGAYIESATPDYELYAYDGVNPPQLAANINPSGYSFPGYLTAFNTLLCFQATDGSSGYELYSFNGSSANRVADINPGSGSSLQNPGFTEYNGALYFAADDGSNGIELWKFDGVNASLVADINSGSDSGLMLPAYFAVYDNELYFAADDGTVGFELFKYDGTEVSLAADINPSGDSSPSHLEVYDNRLYFQANEGTNGKELWVFY